MDYYSITTSDVEWRAAICLCGSTSCRGSFLHFATQDELQRVLNSNCGPLWRYASLLRSCASLPLTDSDQLVLSRHGISRAVLGDSPPLWMKKYVSDILRFIEYERKALPCALMRSNSNSKKPSEPSTGEAEIELQGYDFSTADMDARCVMEQRVQSVVCALSMISRVIEHQGSALASAKPPMTLLGGSAICEIFEKMKRIPELMEQFLLQPLQKVFAEKEDLILNNKKKLDSAVLMVVQPSQDPSIGKRGKKICIPTAAAMVTESDNIVKIQNAINAIRTILTESVPQGQGEFRSVCLSIKQTLLQIESLSTPIAR
jgi:hypothetical protein